MEGWQNCGELVALGARIDLDITFGVEDGATVCHREALGFTQEELAVLNEFGVEEGLMRLASERLAGQLDSKRKGWRQAVEGYCAEGKEEASWRKLRLALGIEKKRGLPPVV